MTTSVVSFFRVRSPQQDWSGQELAEFYRVEAALIQAGLRVETDRGLSDDGEPWFVFCRPDGEVFIHIARISGIYVLAGPAYEGLARGENIRALVEDLVSRHPLVQAGPNRRNSNIFLHPAALLVAVVATAFLKSGEAQAHSEATLPEAQIARAPTGGGVPVFGSARPADSGFIILDAGQSAIVMVAIASILGTVMVDREERGLGGGNQSAVLSHALDDHPAANSAQHSSAQVSAFDALSGRTGTFDGNGFAPDTAHEPRHDIAPADVSSAEGVQSLALVAVLWDLPKSAPAPVASTFDGESLASSLTTILEGAIASPPTVTDQTKVLLEVSRSWDLPSIDAAKIIFGQQVIALIDLKSVSHVSEIPALIKNAIEEGLHVVVGRAPPDLSGPQLSHDGLLTPPPSSGAPEVLPINLETGGALDTTMPVLDALQSALQVFLNSTPQFKVIATDRNVVIYDPVALTHQFMDVKSFTWDFQDGSTLSLVGLPTALPDFLV
jgi:hypothetical protein